MLLSAVRSILCHSSTGIGDRVNRLHIVARSRLGASSRGSTTSQLTKFARLSGVKSVSGMSASDAIIKEDQRFLDRPGCWFCAFSIAAF